MDMKTYREQFQAFLVLAYIRANRCTRLDEFSANLSEISQKAVWFYTHNSELHERNYQQKIQIFLDFDNDLKYLKRKFTLNLAREANRSSFFKQEKEPSVEDISLLQQSTFHR